VRRVSTDARHALGLRGEEYAAQHLERLGFEVIARRHRTRHGELDLVARDGSLLVFCEVKTRRAGSGHPFDAMSERKQLQVRRMGLTWLSEQEHQYFEALRFDAIGVVLTPAGGLVSLDHLEGAF
jgi:putative endonuclease